MKRQTRESGILGRAGWSALMLLAAGGAALAGGGPPLTPDQGKKDAAQVVNTCENPTGDKTPLPVKRGEKPARSQATTSVQNEKPVPCNQNRPDTPTPKCLIDNLSFNHIFWGWDYRAPEQPVDGLTQPDGHMEKSARLPAFELRRIHRYRDVGSPSSLGPGVFLNLDIRLEVGLSTRQIFYGPNPSLTMGWYVTLNDPQTMNATRICQFGTGPDLLTSSRGQILREARILGTNGVPVQPYPGEAGLTVSMRTEAREVQVNCWDGRTLYFELANIHDVAEAGAGTNAWAANNSLQGYLTPYYYGRLTRIEDRNGYALNIGYQDPATNFQCSIYGSQQPGEPGGWYRTESDLSKFWRLGTVTDAYGNQATFHYATNQMGGNWAVEQVDLPNGASVTYGYTSNFLSSVSYPDGSQSTFTRGYDTNSKCVTLEYHDAGAFGPARNGTTYLTTQYTTMPDNPDDYFPQSAQLVRMVLNGAGEVSYLNIPHPQYTLAWIYEGGGLLKQVYCGWQARYATSWTMTGPGYGGIQATLEPNYQYANIPSANNYSAWYTWTPDYKLQETGLRMNYQYDSDGFAAKVTFPADNTSDQFWYNRFKQITNQLDRLGRRTLRAYDARGNLLSETRAAGTADEATWTRAYYPTNDPLHGLLKSSTDANGNVTEYAYDEARRLIAVTAPPDAANGDRAVTHYAYDDAGRLSSVTDPAGRTVSYAYDSRNRVTAVTDGLGAQRFVYGTNSLDANLLIETTDRAGGITRYQYDAAGRLVLKTSGLAAEGSGLTAAPLYESWTYVPGRNEPASHRVSASTNSLAGQLTGYAYDYRMRLAAVTNFPSAGAPPLVTTLGYLKNRLDCSRDPYGRATWFGYDANDRLVKTVRETVPGVFADSASALGAARDDTPNPRYLIETVAYDAEGQILSRTDPRGILDTLAYDAQGRLTNRVAAAKDTRTGAYPPEGAQTTYRYDPQGNVLEITLPRSFQRLANGTFQQVAEFRATNAFTGRNLVAGRTAGASAPEAATVQYAYGPDGLLAHTLDAENNLRSLVYRPDVPLLLAAVAPAAVVDASGALKRSLTVSGTDAEGRPTFAAVLNQFEPDANLDWYRHPPADRVLSEVTARYDARGRLLSRTLWLSPLDVPDAWAGLEGGPDQASAQYLKTTWRYDEDLTDGVGLDADYAAKLALLGTGFFGANAPGGAVEVTNPKGEKGFAAVDGLGRTVLTVNPAGEAVRYVYDAVVPDTPGAQGALVETVAIRDPANLALTTRARADGAGRTLAAYDALGKASLFGFDAAGNLLAARDPNNVGHDSLFDAIGRETERRDTLAAGDGGPTRLFQTTYDPHGNPVRTVDALGHAATAAYDALDRRTNAVDRLGGVTRFAYNRNGNLVSLTDAEGNVTTWGYDARGLATAKQYPGHNPTVAPGHLGYDQRLYWYDAAGRLFAREAQDGTITGLGWDMAGRLLLRQYSSGWAPDIFAYDEAGRLVQADSGRYQNSRRFAYDAAGRATSESLTIGRQDYAVGYQYDAAGRETALTYPDGRVVTRTFTARDEVAELRLDGSSLATFEFDPAGREVSRRLGLNIERQSTFRADDVLKTIRVPGVVELRSSFDANKRKVEEVNPTLPAFSHTLAYDAKDRLTEWSRTGTGSGLPGSQAWDLTLEGDWRSTTRDTVVENRQHDAAHRVRQVDADVFAHDLKGNLAENPQRGHAYAWDDEDRLAGVFQLGTTNIVAAYVYDALGNRVAKATGGTLTVYVLAGSQVLAEYQGGVVQRTFIYGQYVDEPVAMVAGGQTYYFHQNDQYSVVALTDAGGNVVERYAYDAYGEQVVLDAAGNPKATRLQNFGYTGREWDAETGLWFYRARYYDSRLGRFISRDPMGELLGGVNLYEYCDGDPFACLDPFGLTDIVYARTEGARALNQANPFHWIRHHLRHEMDEWGELQAKHSSSAFARHYTATVRSGLRFFEAVFALGDLGVAGEDIGTHVARNTQYYEQKGESTRLAVTKATVSFITLEFNPAGQILIAIEGKSTDLLCVREETGSERLVRGAQGVSGLAAASAAGLSALGPKGGLTKAQLVELEETGWTPARMGQLNPRQLRDLMVAERVEYGIYWNEETGAIAVVKGGPSNVGPPLPGYKPIAHTHLEPVPTRLGMTKDIISMEEFSPSTPELVIGTRSDVLVTIDPGTPVVLPSPRPSGAGPGAGILIILPGLSAQRE